MKKFNAQQTIETQVSTATLRGCLGSEERHGFYVGLDVHKETIAVAVAEPGRAAVHYWGEIKHAPKAVCKLVPQLSEQYGGVLMLWCYEAGPCGYGLYRQLLSLGQDCEVVAAPRSDRIKTDRCDACKLRAGELTRVRVPGEEQEAMRDLSRCRLDFKSQERKARQQLNAFVLRHGHHWPRGKTRWTRGHWNWLESLTFPHPWQQVVLQEYCEAVRAATRRVNDLTAELMSALVQWSLAPVVDSMVALRGVDKIAAITLLAELGDLTQFSSPKQLMGYLGLVPSEHSTGTRRRQGGITLMGNAHARRMLVEAAWSYRFPARQTMHLKRKAQQASSSEAKVIAWQAQAQRRLCGRYRTLVHAGKCTKVTCVAIARELVGFIWAIVCLEMPKLRLQ
ncbi:MAG: IS110 family transposase [Gammaproteobacteria bacterium]|nr:IS110 family transposase [Gammaproteobacteria bacterium]